MWILSQPSAWPHQTALHGDMHVSPSLTVSVCLWITCVKSLCRPKTEQPRVEPVTALVWPAALIRWLQLRLDFDSITIGPVHILKQSPFTSKKCNAVIAKSWAKATPLRCLKILSKSIRSRIVVITNAQHYTVVPQGLCPLYKGLMLYRRMLSGEKRNGGWQWTDGWLRNDLALLIKPTQTCKLASATHPRLTSSYMSVCLWP